LTCTEYRERMEIVLVDRNEYGFQQEIFDDSSASSGTYAFAIAVRYDILIFNCSITVYESGEIWKIDIPLEESEIGTGVGCTDKEFVLALEDITIGVVEMQFPGDRLTIPLFVRPSELW
jgi:hypothetical protein